MKMKMKTKNMKNRRLIPSMNPIITALIISLESPEEERDLTHVAQSTAEIRNVFGDSDEEEPADYGVQRDMEHRSPLDEEESYDKILRPDDLVRDEEAQYGSEEEIEARLRQKTVGPLWNLKYLCANLLHTPYCPFLLFHTHKFYLS